MYAVVHADSGKELSYHQTVKETLETIKAYENSDNSEDDYDSQRYDWEPVE